MARIAIAILALTFAGCQAHAGWPHSSFDTYHSAPAPRKPAYRPAPKPRVIKKVTPKPAPVVSSRCASPLTREGDQYATVTGAKAEADKAWMQAARWMHGEIYMDLHYAEGVTYACGRSSVGSVAGQVFYRCEITARPCKATKVGE